MLKLIKNKYVSILKILNLKFKIPSDFIFIYPICADSNLPIASLR